MEESPRRNNVTRRVTPMGTPKPPPPRPKPKPPKLSSLVSNKVDSDSVPPPKRTNSNTNSNSNSNSKSNSNSLPIRGTVNRLSSVFEDKDDKPRVAPSLPLSPKLPVPTVTVKTSKSFSRDRAINKQKTDSVDESHYAFSDIQAKFQQAEGSDVTLPNPAKKPAALRSTISKSPERMPNNVNKTRTNINTRIDTNSKTTIVKRSSLRSRSDTKLAQPNPTPIIDDDLENLGRDWIDITDNYLPEIENKPTKGVKGSPQSSPVKSKKPSRLNSNSSNDGPSSPKKQNSLISSDDFEAKRASIANLFAASTTKQRNSERCYSKALPPTPPSKSPTESSPRPSEFSHSKGSSESDSVDHSKDTSSDSSITLVDNEPKEDMSLEQNRRKKLWNVIKELVDTERTFYNDMALLEKVYADPAREIPMFDRFDCKTIFNNLPDIIDFSGEFLELLERAAGIEGPDDVNYLKHLENENNNTYVGAAFSQMMKRQQGDESKMEAVYSEYCKRHEAAVQKLQEFDKDENVQGWLQKCKNQCEGLTRSWDISSLLIKPVQRVLKYPLLLQQIVSLTKPSHPDFEELKFAFSEIQNVAERINEIKRRKDIVEKIVGSKKKTDTDSITRRGQMIKHATGISKATEDELYNLYVEKFRNLESRGQQLARDVREWVKIVKLYFEDQERMAAVFEDFYILGDQANKSDDGYRKLVEYAKAIREIAPTHGKEMEEAVAKRIYPQIERFLELFKAPAAVMKKREKKILDFDRAMAIKSKGGTLDKHLQQSADAFKSISDQLHEELPSFFNLMIQYFDIIMQELIKIQSRLYQQIGMDFSQYYYKVIEFQALEHVSDDREMVLRKMDIDSEYTEFFHGQLGMEDQLNNFVLLTCPAVFETNENGRGRRSSWSDSSGSSSRRTDDIQHRSASKDPNNRKGGLWDENTDRFSWHSNSRNSIELDPNHNIFDNEFNFISIKQRQANKYSSHKKYATDSAIAIHDYDDDTLIEEKVEKVEKDKALFLCQTLYSNKSHEKNELNFERGVLLRVIHIDDSGEWWFAINEDTQERGWVEPGFVERLD